MNKLTASLTAALMLSALPALGYSYPIESLYPGTVHLKARDKSSASSLWKSVVRTYNTSFEGRPFLYVVEEGHGKYGSDGKVKSWKSQSYSLIEDGKVIPYQAKQVFNDQDGNIISSLQKDYHRADGKVVCQINGKQKTYDFQDDLIDREILGLYVRNFPFGKNKEVPFRLMTNEPSQYKISLKDLGLEKITVDDQTYLCYKLQLLLDLGAINLFSGFFPKTYFWVNAAEPHEVVRYEGLESALGTPYIQLDFDKYGK